MDKDDYMQSIGLFADFFVKATDLEDWLLVSSFCVSEHIQEGFLRCCQHATHRRSGKPNYTMSQST